MAFRGGSEPPTPRWEELPTSLEDFAASSSSLVLVQETGLGCHPLTGGGVWRSGLTCLFGHM